MKTIIIGAGPAGMMAAIYASCPGNEVVLLEKNEKAGKKLFITGKGRCNVTNACNEEEYIKHVVNNPKFMYSAIHFFSCNKTMSFFEERNTPLVVERGNRVFPKSYHAYDITDALVKECLRLKVRFSFSTNVLGIRKEERFLIETNKGMYEADYLVVATGGVSYPATGSTGDGYRFAKALSHHVIEPVPALTGLLIKEKIPSRLCNFTLKNVTLKISTKKHKFESFGELTFYSNYLDGPIAIKLSSLINRINKDDISMSIDLKPALDETTLYERIAREVEGNPTQKIETLLSSYLPSAFFAFFKDQIHLPYGQTCATFSKEQRIVFVRALKHFPLTYLGLNGFDRAVVTSGGVSTKEVSPKTMESKLVSGLYFAGEVLDVDAYTGGFNLQTAFATGALAGNCISEKILK